MEEKQRNNKKRLNSLILLVAFTAIMLIVSTYAWFSSQKSVTVGNLEGTVKVAEGLQISLDATNWSQEVDFSKYTDQTALKTLYGATEHNIIPSELLPVSSNGTEGVNAAEIPFYRGINEDAIKLHTIEATDTTITDVADNQYPGYYAIDLFLKNDSRVAEGEQGTAKETLQLNTGSDVTLKTGGSENTGLQNTPRVAFAMFDGSVNAGGGTLDQTTILNATVGEGRKITDVAIWEPNADAHVDFIVTQTNPTSGPMPITFSKADAQGYLASAATWDGVETAKKLAFTGTEMIPTYALTATSVTGGTPAGTMADLYNWDGTTNASLSKQIALQTPAVSEGGTTSVYNLISTTTNETAIYTTDIGASDTVVEFQMLKNTVLRVRMYVWLEGQDPDCINYASHGAGIHLDIGLIKGAEGAANANPVAGDGT